MSQTTTKPLPDRAANRSRRELANAIRALSMDAVQQAKSGHPGMPMGMADIAEVLWNDYLRHNPANPKWADRDRFVVSNGHGSMLLYSLLHLTGYGLPMQELKNFRQLHSKTPGHPEYGMTPGVETTTGPLGQGLANAIGMAFAEKVLGAQFNRDGHNIIDHYTYAFTGDGCLMEGVSHEACSLAGTLGLGKLIVFYDDNGISIDGDVQGWFTDDTPKRFESYGWHVIPGVDGHNADAIRQAVEQARAVTDKPTLICCKTVIGFGAPNLCGTAKTHGEALGKEEVAATRKNIGWNYEPFVVPDEIYQGWDARARGAALEQDWNQRFEAYRKAHPDLAAELQRRLNAQLPSGWDKAAQAYLQEADQKAETMATRKASLKALEGYGPALPELFGGSADLTGSNLTKWSGSRPVNGGAGDPAGNYVFFGVREFGMSALLNGFGLHGGFIPYSGTFLVFSDYARNAVRMSALMGVQQIYVYTHDSIGLGEDGPTHQPIEHVSSLRLIPNMVLWRPCDTVETAAAWKAAIERRDGPTALVLTRQNAAFMQRSAAVREQIARGGYVLVDCEGAPEAILIATGSEVALAVDAANKLAAGGKRVRVVSIPSTQVFDRQDQAYRDRVLPPTVTARVAVEAGVTDFWLKYVGSQGKVVGINRFGESAQGQAVFEHFGFTADNVARTVTDLL